MSAWTKERTCLTCHATFTLKDHGHIGARGLAESLDAGHASPPPDDTKSIANRCPTCNGQVKDVDANKMFDALKVRREPDSNQSSRKMGGRLALAGVAVLVIFGIKGVVFGDGIDAGTWAFSGLFIFIGLAVLLSGMIKNR